MRLGGKHGANSFYSVGMDIFWNTHYNLWDLSQAHVFLQFFNVFYSFKDLTKWKMFPLKGKYFTILSNRSAVWQFVVSFNQ